jgi:hypothetical protein
MSLHITFRCHEMKYAHRIDTKRIRDSHIGKCRMALITLAFKTYGARDNASNTIGLFSSIMLYRIGLHILQRI